MPGPKSGWRSALGAGRSDGGGGARPVRDGLYAAVADPGYYLLARRAVAGTSGCRQLALSWDALEQQLERMVLVYGPRPTTQGLVLGRMDWAETVAVMTVTLVVGLLVIGWRWHRARQFRDPVARPGSDSVPGWPGVKWRAARTKGRWILTERGPPADRN